MELTLDQALQKGIEAHKAGQVQDADRFYTAILKANPKHPDANHNMGVLAVGVGKVEAALPFFKTALETNQKVAQYWLSYIDALIKLDRMADAQSVFDQAKSNGTRGEGFEQIERRLSSTPSKNSDTQEPSQNQLVSLVNLYSQGQFQETLDKGSKLLKQFPSSVNLYNILGAANQKLGKLEEAIAAYTKALSIKPDFAKAYNNMGNALKDQGKLNEAIEAFTKALSIKPDYAQASYNMGNALQEHGKLEEAIEAYNRALAIKPDYAEAFNNMRIALQGTIFNKPSRELQKTIVSLLDKKRYVRPSDISIAAISLLKLEQTLQKHLQLVDSGGIIDSPLDVISDLSDLPLLLKLMSVCPLSDLDLEGLLTNLRLSILSNVSSLKEASPEFIEFQSALALQCFTNEYIYSHTGEEEKILKSLDASVKKALRNNNQPSPQAILALASYKALNQYDWCKFLVVTDDIKEVYSRQVEEPNHEEKLKQDLPVLEEITDNISSKVRAQYEESPYPRWVNLGLPFKPFSILEVVDQNKLKLYDNKITEIEKPDTLIAGCGTGQHSIESAAVFKSSTVLAIDLSLSSLAYAKRKTEELGIENIDYMQADILDLGLLNKQFDIIESGGVLHHMDDPMAGWKVLTDCLKPGGLMKIGLYSELARQHIVKVRKEISNAGIRSSDEEMKSFRDTIMRSKKDHHKLTTFFPDFFSLSELKDLLFHVQEHRFTIPQIKDSLTELGLKFCGFKGNMIENFKLCHPTEEDPYDLNKWQSYEEANPRAFTGMYQFWCQKVD